MEGSSALRASAQPLLRTPARCQRLTKAFGSTRPARAPAARLMHGQRLHVRLQAESSPEFATSELAGGDLGGGFKSLFAPLVCVPCRGVCGGRPPGRQPPPVGPPPAAETAALDQLIDMLLSAKNSEELSQLVAQNIMSYDQRFWLRLATRSDTAAGEEEKQRLAALAKVRCAVLCSAVLHGRGVLQGDVAERVRLRRAGPRRA